MKLLLFQGTGRGFMSGVSEYLTITSFSPEEADEWAEATDPAPGFELKGTYTLIADHPAEDHWLPEDTTLIPRF